MTKNIEIAIEVLNLSKEGLDAIKKEGGVRFYEENGRLILYPIGKGIVDLVEEVGYDLGEDVTAKVVYFNSDNHQVYEAPIIGNKLADDSVVVFEDDLTFAIEDISDVVEFIQNESDVTNQELTELGASPLETNVDAVVETESEPSKSNDLLDHFQDDSEDDLFDEFSDEELDATSVEHNDDEDISFDDFDDRDLDDDNEASEIARADETNNDMQELQKIAQVDYKKADIEDDDNPLMNRARQLFENRTLAELPAFDKKTHDNLQGDIVQAESNVTQAKKSAILAIYNKLVENYTGEFKIVSDQDILMAERDHKKTLEELNYKQQVDQVKISKTKHAEYEQSREEFVQAKLPELRSQYDQEHLTALENVIRSAQKSIENDIQQLREAENAKYTDYLNDTKQAVLERVSDDKVNVDNIISKYDDVVNKESSRLKEAAKTLKAENEDLKNEIDVLTSSLKQLKLTQEDIVNAAVAREKLGYIKQLNEAEQTVKKAQSDLREEQVKTMALAAQGPRGMQVVGGEQTQEPKQNKWMGILAGFSGGALLVTVVMLMFSLSSNNSKNVAQQAVNNTPATAQSTQQTADEGMKKGDKFDYTTSDGENVSVIVDSAHTGHYIDGQGKNHSVVF